MRLPGPPAGRLEKTKVVTEGNKTTKFYVNHKTCQEFHYVVERDKWTGKVLSRTWYSDTNPQAQASS